jgi:Tol biopolymer transport system component
MQMILGPVVSSPQSARWTVWSSRALLVALTLLFSPAAQAQGKKLCIMDADGTQLRTLSHMEGYASEDSPFWSHDGKRVAFDATIDNPQNNHIFVVDASGGEPRDLGLGSEPSWSADDKQLCFFLLAAQSAGEKAGIYVMNADGNARQYVTSGRTRAGRPTADESLTSQSLMEARSVSGIFWTARAGSSSTTKFGSLLSPPAWSPDSKQVAFLAKRERNAPIMLCVVDAQGDAVDSAMLKEDVAELCPVGRRTRGFCLLRAWTNRVSSCTASIRASRRQRRSRKLV